MASRREVVVATENYLRSKGYNNSTGKYDRVIMGVKSLLGETLLTYGSPEFERAIQQETERMLKKYVKDEAMEYDPIMCMMVPAKDQRTVDANMFSSYIKKAEEHSRKLKDSIKSLKEDWSSVGKINRISYDISAGRDNTTKELLAEKQRIDKEYDEAMKLIFYVYDEAKGLLDYRVDEIDRKLNK